MIPAARPRLRVPDWFLLCWRAALNRGSPTPAGLLKLTVRIGLNWLDSGIFDYQ
jgi:hypothetical protein